uniref:CRISPR-associated protein Csc2 n=1 Tax=uncultured Thiotrichaceae bacterium TaxID=298394 RepID=A0A6S6TCE2_9GAMM|nr:MAG: CRISPR-associated protein Csc2 [uncultured Thiotrichaceae bacterium]
MNTELLNDYLADIDALNAQSTVDGKKYYIHPKLKNLGCINLVVIREAIAPVVFRNAEPEITDIAFEDEVYVRAVPNKFKYVERGRGLQILRALNVGGKQAQNKTVLYKGQKPSDAFDLNALVFGDSANFDSRVLPVRAAVNYSDALSTRSKYNCVDETFHNRAMEDGTLYDAEKGKNSDNLFTRHFIKPGTLMVQVLSSRGKMLPEIALQHLLLSVGMAGSYGGQTSVTGTNIRTHIVGLYADKFENSLSSPYELLRTIKGQALDVEATQASLHEQLAQAHAFNITGAEVAAWQAELIEAFNEQGSPLEKSYQQAAPKVAALFDEWFK